MESLNLFNSKNLFHEKRMLFEAPPETPTEQEMKDQHAITEEIAKGPEKIEPNDTEYIPKIKKAIVSYKKAIKMYAKLSESDKKAFIKYLDNHNPTNAKAFLQAMASYYAQFRRRSISQDVADQQKELKKADKEYAESQKTAEAETTYPHPNNYRLKLKDKTHIIISEQGDMEGPTADGKGEFSPGIDNRRGMHGLVRKNDIVLLLGDYPPKTTKILNSMTGEEEEYIKVQVRHDTRKVEKITETDTNGKTKTVYRRIGARPKYRVYTGYIPLSSVREKLTRQPEKEKRIPRRFGEDKERQDSAKQLDENNIKIEEELSKTFTPKEIEWLNTANTTIESISKQLKYTIVSAEAEKRQQEQNAEIKKVNADLKMTIEGKTFYVKLDPKTKSITFTTIHYYTTPPLPTFPEWVRNQNEIPIKSQTPETISFKFTYKDLKKLEEYISGIITTTNHITKIKQDTINQGAAKANAERQDKPIREYIEAEYNKFNTTDTGIEGTINGKRIDYTIHKWVENNGQQEKKPILELSYVINSKTFTVKQINEDGTENSTTSTTEINDAIKEVKRILTESLQKKI